MKQLKFAIAAIVFALSAFPAFAYSDLDLYREVATKVANGEGYYSAAASLHSTHHYPTRPFFTVRPPFLAFISAWLGPKGLLAFGFMLYSITIGAWTYRFRSSQIIVRLLAAAGAALAGVAVFSPGFLYMHEFISGLLLSSALAFREKWRVSLTFCALALFIRELALPFALLSLAFALLKRNHREAISWASLIVSFIIYVGVHWSNVAAMPDTGNQLPGWISLRGSVSFANTLHSLPPYQFFPIGFVSLILLLAMVGSIRDSFAFALLAGYLLAFSIAGSDKQLYWGFLIAFAMPLCASALGQVQHLAKRVSNINVKKLK